MERPKCVVCGKKVKDWKTLKHSVTWDGGELQGKYMHRKCFIKSGECEREVIRALTPLENALKEFVKK
jgi:hypothetical protein